jgi:hypothetical protein
MRCSAIMPWRWTVGSCGRVLNCPPLCRCPRCMPHSNTLHGDRVEGRSHRRTHAHARPREGYLHTHTHTSTRTHNGYLLTHTHEHTHTHMNTHTHTHTQTNKQTRTMAAYARARADTHALAHARTMATYQTRACRCTDCSATLILAARRCWTSVSTEIDTRTRTRTDRYTCTVSGS